MKTAIFSSAIAIFATLATALPTAAPAVTEVENLVTRDNVKQVINSGPVVIVNEDTPNTPLGFTNTAKVSRADNMHSSQALLRFNFPAGIAGSKCRLAFAYPDRVTGTGEIQVFTIGDTNIAAATYSRKPFRDQFKGSFRVSGSGEATVVDGSGLTFDCPNNGAQAYEVVSVGENNEVSWYAPSAGLRIDVL
ncbi:hypothetical protein HOY80DRAFT_988840 [Tuber brumale]|nr:hypothetical protein HOY80DRAFT_988840 [Tuber brumale]